MLPDSSIFRPEPWLLLTDLAAQPSGEQAGAALPKALLSSSKHFPDRSLLPASSNLSVNSISVHLCSLDLPHTTVACGVCRCSEGGSHSAPFHLTVLRAALLRSHGLMLPCGHKFPYHPEWSWQRRGLGLNPGSSLGVLGQAMALAAC